jgi:hypothetical protein
MYRFITILDIPVEETNNKQDLMLIKAKESAIFQWITKITLFISFCVLLNEKTNMVQ